MGLTVNNTKPTDTSTTTKHQQHHQSFGFHRFKPWFWSLWGSKLLGFTGFKLLNLRVSQVESLGGSKLSVFASLKLSG